jgi:hypothetical protein
VDDAYRAGSRQKLNLVAPALTNQLPQYGAAAEHKVLSDNGWEVVALHDSSYKIEEDSYDVPLTMSWFQVRQRTWLDTNFSCFR